MARRARAVSNVVATMILIMVAVAGGLIAWMFMTQFSKPRTVASLSIASATATIPPDGSIAAVNIMVRNDGNVPLNITTVSFEYAGKTYNETLNRLLSAGAATTLGFKLKPSDFNVAAFTEGKEIQITIYYKDPQGNVYQKTAFATIRIG